MGHVDLNIKNKKNKKSPPRFLFQFLCNYELCTVTFAYSISLIVFIMKHGRPLFWWEEGSSIGI